jgi:hypothetical protein
MHRELTADEIYTVKLSHALRNIHWAKTMSDINFLQLKKCKKIDSLYIELKDYWNQIHGIQQRTNFEVEDLFNDKVIREINHDQLHELLNPNPTYKKYVDNGQIPNINKFYNLLTTEEQKEVSFEEAFVIALERYKNKFPMRKAYHQAQNDLVTRLDPEWLAEYVIDNWNSTFYKLENSKYQEKYKELWKINFQKN